MLAVADTSALNYLLLIHQETLLPVFYARVVIPPAVYRELLRSETPEVVRQWLAHPPGWLTVQPPQHGLGAAAFPKLGADKREAIPLAQELPDAVLVISRQIMRILVITRIFSVCCSVLHAKKAFTNGQ